MFPSLVMRGGSREKGPLEEGYNSRSRFISMHSFPHVATDVHYIRVLG
jgi:hypothetical protein